ncbi:hypothetical protein, partial [Burkholderia humptydooensis]
MTVWKITNDLFNTAEGRVLPPEAESDPDLSRKLGGDGTPLTWPVPMPLLRDKGLPTRKKPKPRTDLIPFHLDVLILSQKAFDALGDFLSQFGQLLELNVEGETEYYYNVTNVVSCIDPVGCERHVSGSIRKVAFNESAVPSAPAVFKDPLTARGHIYVNDGGKAILEERIKERG